MERSALILLCGGSGQRMQGAVEDKVLAVLAGKPVCVHSVCAFKAAGIALENIIITYSSEAQLAALKACMAQHMKGSNITWVPGGAQRQHSVHAALKALNDLENLKNDDTYESDNALNVYIHDAARPCIHPESLQHLQAALGEETSAQGAALAHRVKDTLRHVCAQTGALTDVPRAHTWAMETPQAFPLHKISPAYQRIEAAAETITDDVAAAMHSGLCPRIIENAHPNVKLTTPADLPLAQAILEIRG